MAATEATIRKFTRELGEFLGFTGRAATGRFDVDAAITREPYPWDYSRRELHNLHEEALTLLEGAVRGDGLPGGVSIGEDGGIRMDVVGPADERVLRFGGTTRSCFVLTLGYLLKQPAGKRVVMCPECGRIFVRVRRQIYCRRGCANKATWRKYPEASKLKAREKEYAKQGWELGGRSRKKAKK